MATLVPFRALRPTPESAARVAAVPYDVVNTEEAQSLAAGNPLSFLHVSRAEIGLPADTNPYDDRVYATAVANFNARFIRNTQATLDWIDRQPGGRSRLRAADL